MCRPIAFQRALSYFVEHPTIVVPEPFGYTATGRTRKENDGHYFGYSPGRVGRVVSR